MRKFELRRCTIVPKVAALSCLILTASQSIAAPAPDIETRGLVYAKVLCNPARDITTIIPGEGLSEEPPPSLERPHRPSFLLHTLGSIYPEEVEGSCQWKDGTEVLMHLGADAFSVWVNHAKWVAAAHIFTPRMPSEQDDISDTRTMKVVITSGGLTICTRAYRDSVTEGLQHAAGQKCTTTAKEQLPSQPDLIEYPTPTQRRPKPSTPRIALARDPQLCHAVQNFGRSWDAVDMMFDGRSGDSSGAIKLEHPEEAGLADGVTWHPFQWDINNSGRSLWVVHTGERSHTYNKDTYFAFDAAAFRRLRASKGTDEDLVNFAVSVYPRDWMTCERGGQPDPAKAGSCLGNGLSAVDVDGKKIDWGADNSLILTPFTFRDQHYFVVSMADHYSAMSRGSDPFMFVVKPLAQHRYEVSCALETVQVNL